MGGWVGGWINWELEVEVEVDWSWAWQYENYLMFTWLPKIFSGRVWCLYITDELFSTCLTKEIESFSSKYPQSPRYHFPPNFRILIISSSDCVINIENLECCLSGFIKPWYWKYLCDTHQNLVSFISQSVSSYKSWNILYMEI